MLATVATVVVVTFNLLHGGPWSEWTGDDQDLERRFEIVAAELARLRPDIVALQEASVGRRRGNVAARLGARLGMHARHAPAVERIVPNVPLLGKLAAGIVGFTTGPAILSRDPIVASETLDLPRCSKWYDARVALAATVRTPAGDLAVYSTHTSRDDCQLARLAEIARSRPDGLPAILMGDLNTVESAPAMQALRAAGFVDAFRDANPDTPGATVWQPVHAAAPMASRRVDYVLVRPGRDRAVRVEASRVVLATPERGPDGATLWPSDHHGVLATIALAPVDRRASAGVTADTVLDRLASGTAPADDRRPRGATPAGADAAARPER